MVIPIKYVETPVRPPRSELPLGDMVAVVAQPIARTADAVFGTDVTHCGGCKARRQAYNKAGQTLVNIVRDMLSS